jgi:hypothetical protein
VLAFETKPLREVCRNEAEAKAKLGAAAATELKRVLADLRAANSIEDLPVGKFEKLTDSCLFQLDEKMGLLVVSNHVKKPLLPNGQTNWAAVQRIKITQINSALK